MRIDPNSSLMIPKQGLITAPDSRKLISPETQVQSSVMVSTLDSGRNYGAELHARLGEIGREEFKNLKQVLQLPEFFNETWNDPVKYLRSVAWYVLDCVDYWDKYAKEELGWDIPDKKIILGEEVTPHAILQKPWIKEGVVIDKECVQGQLFFLNQFLEKVRVLARKKNPNRQIIVHGPFATGKSRFFEILFEGLEEYSKKPEGAIYTYNWVFEQIQDFGFQKGNTSIKEEIIKPENVVAVVRAGKNANPIFLYPREVRIELKEHIDKLKKEGKIPHDFNTDYLIMNEMNSLSEALYESLRNMVYEGDDSKVLNHIHCVRWNYSAKRRQGLVLQQPYITDKAELIMITPDRDWSEIPLKIRNAISTAGIHELEGDFAGVNHGIYLEDDVFKDGNLHTHLDKLRFTEKGKMTIKENPHRGGVKAVDEQFDVLAVGTTNDDTLMRAQGYEEWDALEARFFLIPMGFERLYRDIAEVFRPIQDQFIPRTSDRHAHKNALEDFGLFVTLTYLFPPQNPNYYGSLKDIPDKQKEKFISLVTKKLQNNILHKALLYQGEDPNLYEVDPEFTPYSREELALLRRHLKPIKDEFNLGVGRHRFFFYEGSIGLQSRIADSLFESAMSLRPDECFSSIDLFDELKDEIKHGFKYEKKRTELFSTASKRIKELRESTDVSVVKSYIPVIPEKLPSVSSLLEQVIKRRERKIRYDVYKALGCISTEEEQLDKVRKYIAHAMAYVDKDEDGVDSKYRTHPNQSEPDEGFMKDMENIFDKKALDDRKEITRLITSWARENRKIGEQIFQDLSDCVDIQELIKKLNSHDIKANQQWAYEFFNDLKNYQLVKDERSYEDFAKTYKPFVLGKEEKRQERFEKALAILASDETGYCAKCISKHVNFAFRDYSFPYVDKSKGTVGSGI